MKPVYYDGIEFQMDEEGSVYFQIHKIDNKYVLIEDLVYNYDYGTGKCTLVLPCRKGTCHCERIELNREHLLESFYGENWKDRVK